MTACSFENVLKLKPQQYSACLISKIFRRKSWDFLQSIRNRLIRWTFKTRAESASFLSRCSRSSNGVVKSRSSDRITGSDHRIGSYFPSLSLLHPSPLSLLLSSPHLKFVRSVIYRRSILDDLLEEKRDYSQSKADTELE